MSLAEIEGRAEEPTGGSAADQGVRPTKDLLVIILFYEVNHEFIEPP